MSDAHSPFPSDPAKIRALIARDYEMCHVFDMDNPNTKPRMIRLSPREAARWCHVTSLGHYDTAAAPNPIFHDGGWVCGRWIARVYKPQRR